LTSRIFGKCSSRFKGIHGFIGTIATVPQIKILFAIVEPRNRKSTGAAGAFPSFEPPHSLDQAQPDPRPLTPIY
jgi:hypothetical protein